MIIFIFTHNKMSFWSTDDKIPIVQTKVKIPAENGLTFKDGGLIHITIPANSVGFFQPKESYLEWDVTIDTLPTAPTRFQLDADLGGQVLIKDIRIYSGGAGGVLLEEIQNYNTLTAIKYDYESDDTIRKKRALTEGSTYFSQACRNTRGVRKSDLNNVGHNPYFQPYTFGLGKLQNVTGEFSDKYNTTVTNASKVNVGQNVVRCLLPINTGIFSNDRVFPAMLTEGLRIEILLEDAAKCVRQLDQVSRVRGFRSTPIFHSISGHDIGDLSGAAQVWANTKTTDHIFFKRDNNMTDLSNFPLVVGETFELCDTTIDVLATKSLQVFKVQDSGGSNLDYCEVKDISWAAGDSTAPTTKEGGYYGLIKVGLTKTMKNTSGASISGTLGKVGAVSTSVSAGLTNDEAGNPMAVGNFNTASYQVSDVNLVLQKLDMPQGYVRKMMSMMKSGGTINYDFLSATNYKYSQLASDVVANIRMPLNQTRARGILSVPTDASVYSQSIQISGYGGLAAGMLNANGSGNTADVIPDATGITYVETPPNKEDDHGSGTDGPAGCLDQSICSVRSGLVGIWDNATQYQWFYNGQLNPSRPVSTRKIANKTSIGQQPLIELEKALSVCGIRPLSFRKYHENAIIGRALSLQDGTYNTTGKDFNLQIEYTESDAGLQPVKNKLWMNFVHHIRRIVIKGNQISLVV
tara:strand:- start:7104 stop:9176 length:2073 start_codon:yes stop_codon:yes gene_type:complete